MSQMQWIYVDDFGARHKVGIYHGNRSGHVLVHCNGRIVVIDFNVLDDKKYSFLINDELCDLHVEKTKKGFAYGLEIDRKANTPGNLRRRKRSRKHLYQTIAFGLVLVLLILAIVFFMLGPNSYF